MILRFPWWAYGAVGAFLLGLGWFGHAATTKPADARTLALTDSLKDTRKDFDHERARRRAYEDSLLLVREVQASVDSAVVREAQRLRAAAQLARATARGMEQGLALARTAADSIPILVAQKRQLGMALDSLGASVDSLERTTVRMSENQNRLLAVIGSLQNQRTADSARLVIQDGLLDTFRKSAAPCQKWCPTAIAVYEIREKAVSVGAGLRWKAITLAGTYQIH